MTQSTNDGIATTYTYDGDNLRASKTTNNVTTNHILDGMNVVADIIGSTTNSYSRGLSLYASKKGTQTFSYTTNIHGDISAEIDSQNTIKRDYYDNYGNIITEQITDMPFGYTGEYTDTETGLIYLRNRYYDPEICRFISEDPIMDGTNWYSYCDGNPVRFKDPRGLEYIIVSGSEYDIGRYKYNFIQPAIKKAYELKEQNSNETITWVISSAGYTTEQKNEFNNIAKSIGINLKFFSSSQQLVGYINTKSMSGGEESDRKKDKIRKFVVFAHGLEGSIEFGYNIWYAQNELSFSSKHISSINGDAFDNPNSCFYSCNTGTGETSFAQQWVNKARGTTWAVRGPTYYDLYRDSVSYKNRADKKGSDYYPRAFSEQGAYWRTFTNKASFMPW